MRTLRKVVLLCGVAVVAIAFGAPTASASTPIEVVNEATGEHCNPCVVELEGESHLNLLGGRVSTCEDHLVAVLNENGTGIIELTSETHHHPTAPSSCTRIPCNGVGEAPEEHNLEIESAEEVAPDKSLLEVHLCLEAASNPNGTGTHCHADVMATDLGSHEYHLTMHSTCLNSLIELEGEWTATGGDPIELTHV